MFSAEIKSPKMILLSTGVQTAIISPCVGVCRIGGAGLCLGCARTLKEIGTWSYLSDQGRVAVMKELAARKAGAASDSPLQEP
jgi:hypothetical protein